jgi:hypothetical protein
MNRPLMTVPCLHLELLILAESASAQSAPLLFHHQLEVLAAFSVTSEHQEQGKEYGDTDNGTF